MFSFDKRAVYIILAVIVIFNVVNMGTAGLLSLLLTIPGVIIAISFHEFAHAWMAVKLGDDTPLRQGRLSLDPLKHLDPIGILMLMFCGIGWGRPVQIDSSNFNPKYRRNGEALVSLAGPLMNFILAFVLTLIDGLILKFAGDTFFVSTTGKVILTMLQTAIIMNIGLGVFNLIPLPPLDGSKIFIRFMPYNVRNWIYDHEMWFYMAFLVIWITNLSSIIITPIMTGIYQGIVTVVKLLLSLF
ncbi:MAG: site-2 protease family protein [Clostridia bacterium]|nr:site-2 protease family protein [Clostridia bacterium]